MTATTILVVYLVIGCGAAIAVAVQSKTLRTGVRAVRVVSMLFLWPFMLPASMSAEALPPPRTGRRTSERAQRIETVRTKLRDAWAHAGTGAPSAESRERALIEGFLAKLSRQDVRLAELEQTIDSAAISIKPRLVSLRDSTVKDIEDGLALLEEMVAQLTLLRFEELAERAGEGGERDHVEGLLARIEAMASLTRAA